RSLVYGLDVADEDRALSGGCHAGSVVAEGNSRTPGVASVPDECRVARLLGGRAREIPHLILETLADVGEPRAVGRDGATDPRHAHGDFRCLAVRTVHSGPVE